MHKQAVAIWFIFYQHHTGQKYLFDGKSGSNLKQLIKKIQAKVIEIGMEDNEENVLHSFKMFLNSIADPWILDNLEVSIVNSKFNILYAKAIRNSPLGIKNAVDSLIEQREANRQSGQ